MSGFRKAIRQAVAAGLAAAAIPAVGTRVYASRAIPIKEAHLPAILVYTRSEEAVREGGPVRYDRTCELAIEVHTSGGTGADDQLDDIAQAIEDWVEANLENDAWQDIVYRRMVAGFADEGETDILAMSLIYEVRYEGFGTDHAAQAPTDDFAKANVEWDLPPADTSLEAEDDIDIPIT